MIRCTRYLLVFLLCGFAASTSYAFHGERLKKAYAQRSHLIAQLAQLETETGQLAQSLRHTKNAISTNTLAQKKLRKEQHALQQQLTITINTIDHLLQVSYLWQQQPQLKWLLSDRSHRDLSDLNRYQQTIESEREKSITQLRSLEVKLAATKKTLLEKASQLKTLLTQQKDALQTLTQTEASRRDVIAHLDTIIKEERLKKTHTIPFLWPRSDVDSFMPEVQQAPFEKHKLSWPTIGSLNTRYGDTYHHTPLKQHGIVIQAKMGQPVRAVATGEVVFAKWLPGYGHLMIIDHHNGYLSLYGRNRYLEKEPGEWVHTGEEIATIGNSGGYAEPGLYFELRYDAQPVNPLVWLKKYRARSVKKHRRSRWRSHDSSHTAHRST